MQQNRIPQNAAFTYVKRIAAVPVLQRGWGVGLIEMNHLFVFYVLFN